MNFSIISASKYKELLNQSVEIARQRDIILKLQNNLKTKTKDITNLRRMLRYYQDDQKGKKKTSKVPKEKVIPEIQQIDSSEPGVNSLPNEILCGVWLYMELTGVDGFG